MSFGARALIRLGALKHNFEIIRAAAPDAKILAVIKANAYGHGMVAVARTLTDVDALAVARIPEAVRLRDNGIETPLVLLAGVLNEREMSAAIEYDLQLIAHCPEQLDLLESCNHGSVIVWLKFDTGMNRLGFDTDNAKELIARAERLPAVKELRLMTHLSSADALDEDTTEKQIRAFEGIVRDFDGAVSIGNTSGTLGWPEISASRFGASGDNWVRPGIALFGISPFSGKTGLDLGLKPVMQFEARLIAAKAMRKGARVGYTGSYECTSDTMLGIISAGYGDGYSRHFRSGTPVLLNDRKISVIGHVSMDLIAVDLGANCNDRVGDVATLWGDGLPVEEVAPWANAIPYELVCGVMNREASEIVN